jgi:hypothetical protein
MSVTIAIRRAPHAAGRIGRRRAQQLAQAVRGAGIEPAIGAAGQPRDLAERLLGDASWPSWNMNTGTLSSRARRPWRRDRRSPPPWRRRRTPARTPEATASRAHRDSTLPIWVLPPRQSIAPSALAELAGVEIQRWRGIR